MQDLTGSPNSACITGFYTKQLHLYLLPFICIVLEHNHILFFYWPNSTRMTLTFPFGLQFPTNSLPIMEGWTKKGSRGASGLRSPARSWRSWSGFLQRLTTPISTPEKNWHLRSIWPKQECRYKPNSLLNRHPSVAGAFTHNYAPVDFD